MWLSTGCEDSFPTPLVLPFPCLQAQLFDLSDYGITLLLLPGAPTSLEGWECWGMVRTPPTPGARQLNPCSLPRAASAALLSWALSMEQSAPRSAWRGCLQTACSHMQRRWEEAGTTGSVITGQSPASFVSRRIFQVLSNQAEQFCSGNPGGWALFALRKEILCLCNIW